ncbi:recombination-associated protein RdgC [Spirobacillus cienkowskii]|uniref:recombination-associated protein RdgC n=1 Tax=Spirobacillus cienkowskii TaxID=495820 RepID=UPI0030D5F24E
MSIAAGTFAIKRFQILKPSKDVNIQWILQKLQKVFISPLVLDDARESATGFCHPFSGEPNFENPHALIYDQAFVFGMRMDKKKIPATYLKLQLRAAFEALANDKMDANGVNRKIGKKMKETIRDRIMEELLKNTLPSVKLVEVIWFLNSNCIWLTSTSQAVVEEFEKLFTEAFELPLIVLNSGTASLDFESLLLNLPCDLEVFQNISPISLTGTAKRKNKQEFALHENASIF